MAEPASEEGEVLGDFHMLALSSFGHSLIGQVTREGTIAPSIQTRTSASAACMQPNRTAVR